MGTEHIRVSFKPEARAIDIRFFEEHTGIIGEITGSKIIGAVDDDIERADNLEGVAAGEPAFVQDQLHLGIEPMNCISGGLRLRTADVRGAVKNLTLEIRGLDDIKINYPNPANTSRGEVHGDRRAEPARADAENTGGPNFLLTLPSDFGQDQMPRVTADLIGAKFHNFNK